MHYNLVLGTKRTLVSGPVAAAGTAITTLPLVDQAGFTSCVFEVVLGTLTAGQTAGVLKVQGGNKADGSDLADLNGVTVTVADTSASKLVTLEISGPVNVRYLKLVFTRNTQAAGVSSVVAIQVQTKKGPESDDSSAPQTALFVDPTTATTGLTVTTSTYAGSTTKIVSTARTTS